MLFDIRTQAGQAEIEDLWYRFALSFFMIVFLRIDPPKAALKYSLFNRQYSIN